MEIMEATESSNNVRKVSCKEIHEYMQRTAPIVSTMEVADQFDVSGVTARSRLKELAEAGLIVEQRLHSTTVAWHLAELVE